jgi:hypothetical protein
MTMKSDCLLWRFASGISSDRAWSPASMEKRQAEHTQFSFGLFGASIWSDGVELEERFSSVSFSTTPYLSVFQCGLSVALVWP